MIIKYGLRLLFWGAIALSAFSAQAVRVTFTMNFPLNSQAERYLEDLALILPPDGPTVEILLPDPIQESIRGRIVWLHPDNSHYRLRFYTPFYITPDHIPNGALPFLAVRQADLHYFRRTNRPIQIRFSTFAPFNGEQFLGDYLEAIYTLAPLRPILPEDLTRTTGMVLPLLARDVIESVHLVQRPSPTLSQTLNSMEDVPERVQSPVDWERVNALPVSRFVATRPSVAANPENAEVEYDPALGGETSTENRTLAPPAVAPSAPQLRTRRLSVTAEPVAYQLNGRSH